MNNKKLVEQLFCEFILFLNKTIKKKKNMSEAAATIPSRQFRYLSYDAMVEEMRVMQ